jgi:hydroxymethylpyrimidine/phosphomethylpyrimidine kinase
MTPVALTIAGSDPSGGAGLQADLKTFHRFGVYGEAVVTLITAQNTRGIARVDRLPADLVADQIRAVLEDIPPMAAKTGALGSKEVVAAVVDAVSRFKFPLVVDPVMAGKHGAKLLDDDSVRLLIERLIPRAFLLTPNLDEAASLAGLAVNDRESMVGAAGKLIALGAANVLVKGGHLPGDALDILYTGAGEIHEFRAARVATQHTHGSGCTYSAAITAELARGTPLVEAVRRAKDFVTRAILSNPGLGSGQGPLNHFA